MKKILFIAVFVMSVSLSLLAKPTAINAVPYSEEGIIQITYSPDQIKCKVVFKRCSGFIEWNIELSSEEDCAKAQFIATQISSIYTSIACD